MTALNSLLLKFLPFLKRKGTPQEAKEFVNCRRGSNLSSLGGQGNALDPLNELVQQYKDILIAKYSTEQGSQNG